jgi:hypothetical protein
MIRKLIRTGSLALAAYVLAGPSPLFADGPPSDVDNQVVCVQYDGWPAVGGVLRCLFANGTYCKYTSVEDGVEGGCTS